MRWYNYLFSRDLKAFHTGYCKDIIKAIKMHKDFPGMVWPPRPNLLIHLEQQSTEDEARCRLEEIISLTHAQKIKLIEENNPDIVELQIGVNITL